MEADFAAWFASANGVMVRSILPCEAMYMAFGEEDAGQERQRKGAEMERPAKEIGASRFWSWKDRRHGEINQT